MQANSGTYPAWKTVYQTVPILMKEKASLVDVK